MFDRQELKATMILSFPIIFSQLGQMLMGVIDTVMIGRIGAVPLAACALSTSIFALFLVFGFGISSSVSALVARAQGAEEKTKCGEILKHGLVVNLIAGIIMAAIIEGGNYAMNYLGQSPEVSHEVKGFFPILGWSLIPLLLFQGFRQFLEGLSETLIPLLILVAGILLNVLLNWVWIYGNWGSPAYGLPGAGYATLVARIFTLVVIFGYVLSSKRFQAYLPQHRFGKFQKTIFRKILKQGIPSGFQVLFEVGAFSGAAVMMGWFGAKTLAAHQIAINLAALTYMVTMGISIATSIRISQAVGRNHHGLARRIGFTGIYFATALMVVFATMFYFGRHWMPSLYIDDPEVLAIAEKLIVVAAIFQVFDGIQGVAIGALRGMLDVKVPTAMTFFAYWVFSLPMAYLLGHYWHYGPVGVWVALTLGLIVVAILLTARLSKITREN